MVSNTCTSGDSASGPSSRSSAHQCTRVRLSWYGRATYERARATLRCVPRSSWRSSCAASVAWCWALWNIRRARLEPRPWCGRHRSPKTVSELRPLEGPGSGQRSSRRPRAGSPYRGSIHLLTSRSTSRSRSSAARTAPSSSVTFSPFTVCLCSVPISPIPHLSDSPSLRFPGSSHPHFQQNDFA